VFFKPTVAGNYTININAEEIPFEVFPVFFPRKKSVPLRLCFSGVNYKLEIGTSNANGELSVEGDQNAKYNSEKNEINFNISQEGWNEIKLTSKKGLIFHDSVFIKSIPIPKVSINELPSFSINKQRLNTLKSFHLIASHPSINASIYSVESFKVRWVNSNPFEETISDSKVQITDKDNESLRYIIIHSINIRMGNKIKSLEQTIIIPIL
jgi:hypothetical protein